MVHLVGIGGRELSVGRLTCCRSRFTESTLISLGLSQPAVVYTCTNLKMENTRKTRNAAAPKTHHETYSNSATATTPKRLAIKHVPRVSPYSVASIDPAFEELGLVQLSQ